MNKTAVMVFLLLLSLVILITGYRYFVYMNEDPGFCLICHVTEEGYRSWEKSEQANTISSPARNATA
jgi:nitrate/TMAO reductase-like tetraheme cytochrome c subunit